MKRAVTSTQAPAAIGPYSQAIETTQFVFLSGQIPLDPATGQLVEGDIAVQTERVLDNMKAVLEAGATDFDRIVKTTIYLTDLADFAKVNEVYAKRFTHAPPARSTIQAAALPRGARVEIDAIALARGAHS